MGTTWRNVDWPGAALITAATLGALALGAWLSPGSDDPWYAALDKAPLNPPDIAFAIAQDVSYLALSFVRRPDDVTQLRALLPKGMLVVARRQEHGRGESGQGEGDAARAGHQTSLPKMPRGRTRSSTAIGPKRTK